MFRHLLVFSAVCLTVMLYASGVCAQDTGVMSPVVDICDVCFERMRPKCEVQCEKIRNRRGFQTCTEKCSVNRCERDCGYVTVQEGASANVDTSDDALFSDGARLCDYCLRKAKRGGCYNQCRSAYEVAKCLDKCAKRQCSRKCQLPHHPTRKTQPETRPHQCEYCKRVAQGSCSQKCGRDKERPGYVSCEVSCIQETCMKECHPELF